jgi:ATP-dependent RNA helicase SUPV3L1/SUV3
VSDALHERLVLRFVDVKKSARQRPKASPGLRPRPRSEPELDTRATDPRHPFAQLAALRVGPTERRWAGAPAQAWVEEVVTAEHAALGFDPSGVISWRAPMEAGARAVGRIVRGGSIALPDVRLSTDDLGAGAKSRVHRRLLAFARDAVAELVGRVGELATRDASASLRAFVHRLEQSLGTVLTSELQDVLPLLGPGDRAALERAGVRFGAGVVYVPRGVTPSAIATRVALASTWFQAGRALRAPSGGAVSFTPSRGVDRRAFAAIGYPVIGPRAIRADVLDRLFEQVASEGELEDAQLASWIGASKNELRRVLDAAKGIHAPAG